MQDFEQMAHSGAFLFVVPHLDDEVLGFGTLLQRLAEKREIHVLVSTCGDSLPLGGHDEKGANSDIAAVRRSETAAALELLGVPASCRHFLDFSEFTVSTHGADLSSAVLQLAREINAVAIFAPFRYDQHADHLAVRKATLHALAQLEKPPLFFEYFVYYNYPLLGGDIRRFLRPSAAIVVEPTKEEQQKKLAALRCFVSQTTCYYPGQVRPVLSDELLNEYAEGAEYFVPGHISGSILKRPGFIVAMAQWLQPRLKKIKERMRARLGASKG